jgi:hypothetical protein
MKLRLPNLTLLATLALAAPFPRAMAVTDAEATTGRALVKQYADSIVTVELVATVKVTVADHAQPPRENKVEGNGTVVSASGLTVTVLSMVDPHASMEAMINARGMGGQKIEIGETEFKDVKLRLANNTEVPAVIVLKDPDLNLVFIAPLPDAANPARKFPFVSLDKAATGEVLANYFLVNRAPKSLQRVPLVRPVSIIGIVQKPRQMFLMSEVALGIPVFDPAGLPLGISTQYLENGRPSSNVVLAASDIADLAAQAAAVKPEEKEDAAPAPDKPAAAVAAPATPASPGPAPAPSVPAKP